MNPHPPHDRQTIRRVVLPSGKTVEVVYFEEVLQPGSDLAADVSSPVLHLCARCDAEVVQPVDWHEAGRDRWELTLRCPNCGWESSGTYSQDVVERFEDELDRGTDALLADLRRLQQANMEEDVERFTAALARDVILPEDF